MGSDIALTLDTLRRRYRPETIRRRTVYYLSLGESADEKWTVTLTPTSCEAVPGKAERADCVLKMAAPLFAGLVAGTFRPGAMDFLSGKIKTNDVELLRTLQQAFAL